MIAIEVLGGPLGGWLGERQVDMRTILAVFGASAGVAVLFIPFANLDELVGIFVALGFLDGATFAVMYLLPTYLPETRVEGLSLGLGLLNAIQIFAGSAVAIAFAFVATYVGYTAAWILAGALGLGMSPLLLLVRGHLAPPPTAPATNGSPSSALPTDRAT